jgi:site-specific recombinase XerD
MRDHQDTPITTFQNADISALRSPRDAKDYIAASRADSTLKAYRSDWANFTMFCTDRKIAALPAAPENIADYLAWLAISKKTATIQRHLASISVAHKTAGFSSPASDEIVRLTMSGIRRTLGCAQTRKTPIRVREIRAILVDWGVDIRSIRDKAILLTAYGAALRRSELVALELSDIKIVPEGMVLRLRRSKGDQTGMGQEVAVMRGHREETCPVRAMEDWLAASGIVAGPLFRSVIGNDSISCSALSDRGVARILKKLAKRAGLNPESVSGHSCRAGLVTDAFLAGVAQAVIGRHTRHRPGSAALSAYLREDQFRSNPSGMVGL